MAGNRSGGIAGSGLDISEEETLSLRDSIAKMATAADQLSQMAELTTATKDYIERISGIADVPVWPFDGRRRCGGCAFHAAGDV